MSRGIGLHVAAPPPAFHRAAPACPFRPGRRPPRRPRTIPGPAWIRLISRIVLGTDKSTDAPEPLSGSPGATCVDRYDLSPLPVCRQATRHRLASPPRKREQGGGNAPREQGGSARRLTDDYRQFGPVSFTHPVNRGVLLAYGPRRSLATSRPGTHRHQGLSGSGRALRP
jgi:hypothetical protein